jgi:hypothetical protein
MRTDCRALRVGNDGVQEGIAAAFKFRTFVIGYFRCLTDLNEFRLRLGTYDTGQKFSQKFAGI